MLTIATRVGVVDRTGLLQWAASRLDLDATDVALTSFARAELPDLDVLVVGPRELSPTGLRRVERWTRSHPAGVAVAYVDGLPIDRATLRAAGVHHVLRGRLTPAKLAGALRRADSSLEELLAAAGRFHQEVVAEFPKPREVLGFPQPREEAWEELDPDDFDADGELVEPEPASVMRAKLVTIASATGGCGKTFFATNAAALLAAAGNRVLLVDLDLQFGEVAAALRVSHPYSLYDGLYTNRGERLPRAAFTEHLDELVHHHPLGFDVLTAPRDPVLADYVGARDAATVLDAVGNRYDVVIADTPPSLNDVVIAALDRSVSVIVLATLDVPSLRNLTAFLDVLRRLGLDDERIDLLLNKAEPDVGVTVAQANDAFEGRFHSVLPVDRAVSRSVNLGTTVVTHEPRSKVSRALVPAVGRLVDRLGVAAVPDTTVPEPDARPWLRTLLTRMFRRQAIGGSS